MGDGERAACGNARSLGMRRSGEEKGGREERGVCERKQGGEAASEDEGAVGLRAGTLGSDGKVCIR